MTAKRKVLKNVVTLLSVSYAIGFAATHFLPNKGRIEGMDSGFSSFTLLYSILPAIVAFFINKQQGGSWKDLGFRKPQWKQVIYAFFLSLVMVAVIYGLEVLMGVRSMQYENFVWSEMVASLLFGPILLAPFILGEEIGWRGYLQDHATQAFGKLKGILLLGIIWGLWHVPIALKGFTFPDHSFMEAFFFYPVFAVTYSLIIACISYPKASLWVGLAFHSVSNSTSGFFLFYTKRINETLELSILVSFLLIIGGITAFLYYKKTETEKKRMRRESNYEIQKKAINI